MFISSLYNIDDVHSHSIMCAADDEQVSSKTTCIKVPEYIGLNQIGPV